MATAAAAAAAKGAEMIKGTAGHAQSQMILATIAKMARAMSLNNIAEMALTAPIAETAAP